jgi:site-specific recombinase XerD
MIKSFFHKRLVAQCRASPATIAAYRDALRLLLCFASAKAGRAPSRLQLQHLGADVVLTFLDHLEHERGNSVRTRNARLAAIRSFFQHVAYEDPASLATAQRVLCIPTKRTTTPLLGFLSREEMDALMAAPDRRTWQGRRDYALLLFLWRTGARVSEAIGVDVGDLRLRHPWQVSLHGKGSRERILPLASDTVTALNQWCEERAILLKPNMPVFTNARGQRLTRYGVTHIVRRAVSNAIKQCPALAKQPVSPHILRHTLAMNLLQSGVDPSIIRSWLGHVTLNTTHQYMEADVEMKRRALEKSSVVEVSQLRYRPTDSLLAFLESL